MIKGPGLVIWLCHLQVGLEMYWRDGKIIVLGAHEGTGLDLCSATDVLRPLASHEHSGPMCPCVEYREVAAEGIRCLVWGGFPEKHSINEWFPLPSSFPSPLLSSVAGAFKCCWSPGTLGLLETSLVNEGVGQDWARPFSVPSYFWWTCTGHWFASSTSPFNELLCSQLMN